MQTELRFLRSATISPEALRSLFAQTEWARLRTLSGIERMLRQTPLHMSAWRAGTLVGFARVLTDGAYRALIEDVIVARAYRGCGIGRKLVELLLAEIGEVEEVLLGCMEDLVPFYERLGFKRDSLPLMKRRNNAQR